MKRTAVLVFLGIALGTLIPVTAVAAWSNNDHQDKHPKCEGSYYLNEDQKCVPKRCQYDVSLTITDKKCVKPPVCPTNPQLLQSDDNCVVTPPPAPAPEPTPTPTPVSQSIPVPTTTDTGAQVQLDTTPTTLLVEANGEVFTGK